MRQLGQCWRHLLLGLSMAGPGLLAEPAAAQFFQQGPKLVGMPTGGVFQQGATVSLSGDGTIAAIAGVADSNSGAAWFFSPSRGVWTQQQKLVGGDVVAISADGNTAAIGSPCDNSCNGSVTVFTRSDGVWTQQGQKLIGSAGLLEFGTSVALSADGNTLIVGAPFDSNIGSAWVFVRSGGLWTAQGPKLVGSGSVMNPFQGWSVGLSQDGNTALVGGPFDDGMPSDTGPGTGAAWVFTRNNGQWTQQGPKLIGSGAIGKADQGFSVAISGDGNTAIVGGLQDNYSADVGSVGAAWVFARTNGIWNQQGNKLVGSGGVGVTQQGASVSLSADGNTALIGGPEDNGSVGAAWVFFRSNDGTWAQEGRKLVGQDSVGKAGQGATVALSADSNTALIAGQYDDGSTGAMWVFVRGLPPPSVTSIQPNSGPVGGGTSVTITGTNFTNAVGVNFGSIAATSFKINDANSIVATSPQGFLSTVDATVSTLTGTSPTTMLDQFRYFRPATSTHDTNADGWSDLAWRATAGYAAIWLMKGAQVLQSNGLGFVPPDWSLIGQRDFDGDGKSDLLWRDTAGDLSIWFMNGAAVSSTGGLGNVPTNWTVYGTGDFNADGKGDLLWRNTAGDLAIWFMNGATVASTASLGNVPINWTIIGTDAHGGILWRDTDGNLVIWQVNGSQIIASGVLSISGPITNNWALAAVGDFNGDGMIDLLWRDSNSGTVVIWFLNGVQIQSTASLGAVPVTWTIAQTGDYNGDGMTDILWMDSSGNVAVWFMSGGAVGSSVGLGNVGTTWSMQSLNAE